MAELPSILCVRAAERLVARDDERHEGTRQPTKERNSFTRRDQLMVDVKEHGLYLDL